MAALIEARGLTRRFGGVIAVDSLDFEVGEGELVSLIGPNGAGKTTTFNLISGLDRADGGSVKLEGRAIEGLAPEAIAALGVARTFQHGRVFANLTVLENVLVGAHSRLKAARPRLPIVGPIAELALALIRPPAVRREAAALEAEARVIIARFGDRLTPRLHQPAYSLSYANRRRLEIARALALRPRLLLLDEPTAGMGDQETYQITQLIRRLHRDSNYTIVLIEHDMRVVFHLADRICVLDQGRMLAQGTPQEIAANEAVQAAYLGNAA
jgi:branched-chain amino acid transport system ATP-binding protein